MKLAICLCLIQAKVLRVLQDKRFYPVGSENLSNPMSELLQATNKNLEEQVKQGLFREDLYYRIHVIPIHLPPLRDRKEDIPLLVDHFLDKFREKVKRKSRDSRPRPCRN